MNPKIVYPIPKRQITIYRTLRGYARILFLATAGICLLINLLTRTKLWSIIVIWALFSIWRLIFSLKLIEFSVFSHGIRACFYVVVLLGLIDYFLAPGWAQTVIPICMFGMMLVMTILYFVLNGRKDRHLASILLLGVYVLVAVPYSLHSWPITNWIAFSFLVAAVLIFIILIISNWKDVLYEIRSRLNMHQR
ncbi:MAG: hypothetical protein IKS51_07710 [Erysipelotrichaceae bacterium]|nr:hypothetical protein [Erysipelotrichaceae bacterium]